MTARPEVAGQKSEPGIGADLLRGAAEICREIYGDDSREAQRRLYHEQDRWPIFRLDGNGVFYALRSRLRAHLEAKSAEKEAKIAAAAQTAEVKTAKPHHRRTKRKSPASP